jgi:hypothetical protein
MDEQARTKLEKDLRGYWKNVLRLEGLTNALKNIEKNIQDLRGILAEKEDLIPSPTQLSFTPGGGHGGSMEFTPVERSAAIYEMNQEKIYLKIQELRRVWINKKLKIAELEFKIDWTHYVCEVHLDDFEKKVFEQCYCYRRSNVQVGIALTCDESTIRRKREKILLTFYEFLKLRA